jgi:predicted dehydrogenase
MNAALIVWSGKVSSVGFGVIGAGNWGALHARVYADTPGAFLAGVCDIQQERAQQISRSLGDVPIYTNYRDLLADERIQAVSIVLPDFLHREAAIEAARHGKHILIEKPLATTEEDAQAILDAAKEADVTLMVDFHNRWSPLFQTLRQTIEADELGTAQLITFRLNDTLSVPTKMLSWSEQSSVAWFLASHCLDTLLWLQKAREGADTIERLYCVSRKALLAQQYGVDTPDYYLTTLEWRSGLTTFLENAWILPDSSPSIFDLKFQYIGSKGAFMIDGSHHAAAQRWTQTLTYPDVFVTPTIHARPSGFATESIRHFANRIIEGSAPMVDGLDGLAVTRLILKMEESAHKRMPVSVGALYRD